MHETHLPLRKWFLAIYLMCVSKKGISANQMKRMLRIGSYRTAWYLCHRIREAMGNDRLSGPTLLGVVEVDKTLVGGKVRGKGRKAGRANKIYVAGAIERGGQVRLKRVPNVRRRARKDYEPWLAFRLRSIFVTPEDSDLPVDRAPGLPPCTNAASPPTLLRSTWASTTTRPRRLCAGSSGPERLRLFGAEDDTEVQRVAVGG